MCCCKHTPCSECANHPVYRYKLPDPPVCNCYEIFHLRPELGKPAYFKCGVHGKKTVEASPTCTGCAFPYEKACDPEDKNLSYSAYMIKYIIRCYHCGRYDPFNLKGNNEDK